MINRVLGHLLVTHVFMLCYNQVFSMRWLQESGAPVGEQEGEIINSELPALSQSTAWVYGL